VGGWFDCFQRVINQLGTLENLQNDKHYEIWSINDRHRSTSDVLGPQKKMTPKKWGGAGKFEPLQFLTVLSLLKPKLKKNQF